MSDDPFDELETVDDRPPERRTQPRSGRPTSRPRRETSRPGRTGGGPGGGRPRRPRGGSAALQQPGLRLLLGLGVAILLVLILTLVVRSCRQDQLVSSYKSYVSEAGAITGKSREQGNQLIAIVTNGTGASPTAVRARLRALADQADALTARARKDLSPPDALRDENTSLLSALQLRALGVHGLAGNIKRISRLVKDPNQAATDLASQMKLFLASDVIYQTSWASPTQAALQKEKITGVQVPSDDIWLAGTRQDYVAVSVAREKLLPGLQGSGAKGTSSTSGGVHGTALTKVVAEPSGTQLVPGRLVTLKGGANLAWKVTVQNQGDSTEPKVTVRVTYKAPGGTDRKEGVITNMAAKAARDVTIPGPTPDFGVPATLTVETLPLPNERVLTNNGATYKVQINLG